MCVVFFFSFSFLIFFCKVCLFFLYFLSVSHLAQCFYLTHSFSLAHSLSLSLIHTPRFVVVLEFEFVLRRHVRISVGGVRRRRCLHVESVCVLIFGYVIWYFFVFLKNFKRHKIINFRLQKGLFRQKSHILFINPICWVDSYD